MLREALTYFGRSGGSDLAGFIELLRDLPDEASTVAGAPAIAAKLGHLLHVASSAQLRTAQAVATMSGSSLPSTKSRSSAAPAPNSARGEPPLAGLSAPSIRLAILVFDLPARPLVYFQRAYHRTLRVVESRAPGWA